MSIESVDVIIFGGGIGGTAAAIELAERGAHVRVFTRERAHRMVLGESLSASAKVPLRRLGVWNDFCSDGHLLSYANRSTWGSENAVHFDFILDPRGCAWHIDRDRLEYRLQARCKVLAIRSQNLTRSSSTDWLGSYWSVRTDTRTVRAPFAIDATGRTRFLARLKQIRSRADDRQVAIVTIFGDPSIPIEDSSALIEAVENGWWYSAAFPGRQFVVSYFSDSDISPRPSYNNWVKLLNETSETLGRVQTYGFRTFNGPRMTSAKSERLEYFGGAAWLPVGDAAMAFDPLSAHGITVALQSGLDAADSIVAAANGDSTALDRYENTLERAWQDYSHLRLTMYAQEVRWPQSPYWYRRHAQKAARRN